MILNALRADLPGMFQAVQIARHYNALTGAALSHFEIEQLSIYERDEIIVLLENGDLI